MTRLLLLSLFPFLFSFSSPFGTSQETSRRKGRRRRKRKKKCSLFRGEGEREERRGKPLFASPLILVSAGFFRLLLLPPPPPPFLLPCLSTLVLFRGRIGQEGGGGKVSPSLPAMAAEEDGEREGGRSEPIP